MSSSSRNKKKSQMNQNHYNNSNGFNKSPNPRGFAERSMFESVTGNHSCYNCGESASEHGSTPYDAVVGHSFVQSATPYFPDAQNYPSKQESFTPQPSYPTNSTPADSQFESDTPRYRYIGSGLLFGYSGQPNQKPLFRPRLTNSVHGWRDDGDLSVPYFSVIIRHPKAFLAVTGQSMAAIKGLQNADPELSHRFLFEFHRPDTQGIAEFALLTFRLRIEHRSEVRSSHILRDLECLMDFAWEFKNYVEGFDYTHMPDEVDAAFQQWLAEHPGTLPHKKVVSQSDPQEIPRKRARGNPPNNSEVALNGKKLKINSSAPFSGASSLNQRSPQLSAGASFLGAPALSRSSSAAVVTGSDVIDTQVSRELRARYSDKYTGDELLELLKKEHGIFTI